MGMKRTMQDVKACEVNEVRCIVVHALWQRCAYSRLCIRTVSARDGFCSNSLSVISRVKDQI